MSDAKDAGLPEDVRTIVDEWIEKKSLGRLLGRPVLLELVASEADVLIAFIRQQRQEIEEQQQIIADLREGGQDVYVVIERCVPHDGGDRLKHVGHSERDARGVALRLAKDLLPYVTDTDFVVERWCAGEHQVLAIFQPTRDACPRCEGTGVVQPVGGDCQTCGGHGIVRGDVQEIASPVSAPPAAPLPAL